MQAYEVYTLLIKAWQNIFLYENKPHLGGRPKGRGIKPILVGFNHILALLREYVRSSQIITIIILEKKK